MDTKPSPKPLIEIIRVSIWNKKFFKESYQDGWLVKQCSKNLSFQFVLSLCKLRLDTINYNDYKQVTLQRCSKSKF